jgi:hypothetical protein
MDLGVDRGIRGKAHGARSSKLRRWVAHEIQAAAGGKPAIHAVHFFGKGMQRPIGLSGQKEALLQLLSDTMRELQKPEV